MDRAEEKGDIRGRLKAAWEKERREFSFELFLLLWTLLTVLVGLGLKQLGMGAIEYLPLTFSFQLIGTTAGLKRALMGGLEKTKGELEEDLHRVSKIQGLLDGIKDDKSYKKAAKDAVEKCEKAMRELVGQAADNDKKVDEAGVYYRLLKEIKATQACLQAVHLCADSSYIRVWGDRLDSYFQANLELLQKQPAVKIERLFLVQAAEILDSKGFLRRNSEALKLMKKQDDAKIDVFVTLLEKVPNPDLYSTGFIIVDGIRIVNGELLWGKVAVTSPMQGGNSYKELAILETDMNIITYMDRFNQLKSHGSSLKDFLMKTPTKPTRA